MKYLYNSGLPFGGFLPRDIEEAKKKIDNKFPCAFLIVSPPGKGKTTLATHIAEAFQGEPIVFEDQIGNGFDDFNKKLKICRMKELLVVIYDEGGDIDKRKFMSDTNFKVRRILQLFRAFKVFLIMCLQDFSGLDESVLNMEVIQCMYYIEGRNSKYADYKCYSLERMYWILKNMAYLKKNKSSPNKAYAKVPPNYRGHFLDLPPERAQALELYSNGAKTDMLDDMTGGEVGLYDYQMMAKDLGLSWHTVKDKFFRLGMSKQAIKIKQKNWFTQEQFDIFKQKIADGEDLI